MVDIKTANTSEALECLEEIKSYFPFVDLGKGKEYVCEKEFNTIKQALLKSEKEHKALEIIKEKEVNMQVFNQCEDVETYNKVYIKQKDRQLTEEQFNLLKEVLE